MDRATILDDLALALRRVAEGELHIAQQHEMIASLERGGLDASPLKAALLQLEELQGMLVADRDRLKKELDEKHPRVPTYLDELDLLSFWPRGEK
jgi:hypothetical protein